MDALGPIELACCALVVTGAFAVRGGTGFGASTVAVPFLAFLLPLAVAVPVISMLILGSSAGMLAREWRAIAWRSVLTTVPFTLVGVTLGLYSMAQIAEDVLFRALGVMVVLYAIYGLVCAKRKPQVPPRWRNALAATTGVAGGSLGAVFGAGVGPIYAIYMNALNLDNRAFRVSVSTVVSLAVLLRVGGYAGMGLYQGAVLLALLAAIPFMVLGSWIGDAYVQRLDQRRFSQGVCVLLLVCGTALVVR